MHLRFPVTQAMHPMGKTSSVRQLPVNAIEQFTDVPFQAEADEKKGGYLKVVFPLEGMEDERVQLLLQTLWLGLSGIETEYNKYLTLKIEEV